MDDIIIENTNEIMDEYTVNMVQSLLEIKYKWDLTQALQLTTSPNVTRELMKAQARLFSN